MEKTAILNALDELAKEGSIKICETSEEYVSIFDMEGSKSITFSFKEFLTRDSLKERVYISPRLNEIIDTQKLIQFLYERIDHECFITMDHICFMYDEADYDWLYEYTDDEYAKFIVLDKPKFLGVTWWERNICIIDVSRILNVCLEEAQEDIACGVSPQAETDLNANVCITMIHELRHLLLDTNIVLPESDYPLDEGVEDKVEAYARIVYDINPIYILNPDYTINLKEGVLNENVL